MKAILKNGDQIQIGNTFDPNQAGKSECLSYMVFEDGDIKWKQIMFEEIWYITDSKPSIT